MAQTAAATTASPEEVARFTAIAEEWWDPKGSSARCTNSTRRA